jgi:hypothetical protein
LAKEIELAHIRVGLGRDSFVVTTDLIVVIVLEFEGELALCGVCGPSGYSAISDLVRKLLPSMTTVSTWWRTRSRMAEVSVLSLLKICDQCL